MKFNFNILDMNIETVLVIFLILGLIISFNNKEGLDNLKKSTLLYNKQAPTKSKAGKALTDLNISCTDEDGDDPLVCENKCEAEEKCKNYYWYPASRGDTYKGNARCCLKGEYDESSVQDAEGDFYQMIVAGAPPVVHAVTGGATNIGGSDNKDLDPCSEDVKKPDSCGEVPKDPKKACEQINDEKARMKAAIEIAKQKANITSDLMWGGVKALFTNSDGGSIFGGSEKVNQDINNIFNVNLNNKTISDINQKCIDTSKNLYENSLNIPACTPETMGLSQDNFTTLANNDRIGPFVKGVNQSIKSTSVFDCALNGIIDTIKNDKSTIDQTAIASVMNDLKGTGSISVNRDGCTEVDINKNTCEYISQSQCCSQVRQDSMKNALVVGSCFANIEDLNQSIEILSSSSCGNTTKTFAETISDDSVKNKIKDKIGNTESPNYVAYIIGGIVILVCIIALIKGVQMYMKARSGNISYQGNSE